MQGKDSTCKQKAKKSTLFKSFGNGVFCVLCLTGIPRVYFYSTLYPNSQHNAMVIDQCGSTLERLFNKCNRQFSLKTVCAIADQLIERMEFFHSKGYLHRDLKPDNCLMGRFIEDCKIVYIVDFGLSKEYIDKKTKKHIPMKDGKALTGTARYASINTHYGIEQSRRDDLESLGYIFCYFLKGKLPWQGLKVCCLLVS